MRSDFRITNFNPDHKDGSGTLVLGGANHNFTGDLIINNGTIETGASNRRTLGSIAATNTGTQQKIYVDGQQVASYNINSGPIRDTDINLWIGQVSGGYVSSAFDGLIDDVRIYDYALSDSDVSHLYQIPEPASLLILGTGLLWLRGKRRR